MKRKAVCRFGAYILALLLVFSIVLPCHAASTDSGQAPDESGEEENEEYTLEVNQSQINFGPLEQGSLVTGQDIVLTNKGAGDIWLKWHEADYHDCILVDAPDNDYLGPGESCTFTVTANSALEPGNYSTFILFGDADDTYFENGVQVNISVDIKEKAPAAPVIKSIRISPETAVVSKNSTCAFSAVIIGENDYNKEAVWSVSGQSSRNTFIDSNGVLNVGSDETASSLVVKAGSKQDSNYSATALVSLLNTSYFIQVKASPEKGGSVHGSGTVADGGYVVISAAPNSGYVFEGWSLNGVTVSQNSQYVVDDIHSDRTYVANFKPEGCRIEVSVNNGNAGTATESRTVGYGESMVLEAVAKDGYRFDGWMENGTIISQESKIQLSNITGSRSFTAMFSQNRYTVTLIYSPSNTGTVSGQGTYNKGSDVKVTAVPKEGYRFGGWIENGKVISTNQEFIVQGISKDMCLTASFEKEQVKTYIINAGVSSLGGTITPEGKSTVAEGAGILYSIAPKSGYTIKAVYVDGKSVGAVSSYSFTDIKENHNISADFSALSGQGSGTDKAGFDKADKTDKKKPDKTPDRAEPEDEEDDRENDGQQDVENGSLTGTLQYLNIPVEEAERLIDQNNDTKLLTGALATGDLKVTIRNGFADTDEEDSYESFSENYGVINFDAVLSSILTREEKMEMLLGNAPIAVSFYIDNAGEEEPELITRTFEENMPKGMKVGQYFEMFLMKTCPDDTYVISELSKELQIVITVPEALREAKRDFYILRLHINEEGGFDYSEIADKDNNPDTITFSTDRFSPYAIAYIDRHEKPAEVPETLETAENRAGHNDAANAAANFIVIAAIIMGITITICWMLYLIKRKK